MLNLVEWIALASLVLQLLGLIFWLGVFYATVKVHGKRLDQHDKELEKHGDEINRLKVHTHLEA